MLKATTIVRACRACPRAFALATLLLCATGKAGAAQLPQIHTNQAYVEEATGASTLAIGDPMAVLAFVLDSLPDRVKVYPTENYYYFRFTHAGTPYAGNIRLDPMQRDNGKVQFSYYADLTEWRDTIEGDVRLTLDATRGVTVERLEPLVYRLAYGARSVVFALNDLSQVKPPPTALGPDEKFLGPIFDELGVRFFLVYDARLKIFRYVLDETVRVPEDLNPVARADRILIGRRTGFAYYRDHRLDRKILIGVFEPNSRLNTYFDGPFDQLPENFIEGESLREAIIGADPSVKGQIDRLGNFTDGEGRYLIQPFMLYRKEADLLGIHKCATGRLRAAAYYRCFVTEDQGQQSGPPPPRKKR